MWLLNVVTNIYTKPFEFVSCFMFIFEYSSYEQTLNIHTSTVWGKKKKKTKTIKKKILIDFLLAIFIYNRDIYIIILISIIIKLWIVS